MEIHLAPHLGWNELFLTELVEADPAAIAAGSVDRISRRCALDLDMGVTADYGGLGALAPDSQHTVVCLDAHGVLVWCYKRQATVENQGEHRTDETTQDEGQGPAGVEANLFRLLHNNDLR